MKKPSQATLRTEAYDDAQIARAVKFSTWLRISPRETHQRYSATIAGAQAVAREFMELPDRYGRCPLIYAVTPEGWSIPLPSADQVRNVPAPLPVHS